MQGNASIHPKRTLDGRSIQSRLVDELRQMIVSGEALPGSALSEVVLAETFGVSRTPVREALKQLQVEGLVEIRPRVGTSVSKPSRRELDEMSLLKEIFEGLAARLLALRGNVPEVQALKENVVASEVAVHDDDNARYAELVHEFHDLILRGSDNLKLETHYRMLMNQLAYHRLVMTTLSRPGRPEESVAEHRKVLGAILAKDGYGAERLMRDHVRASHHELTLGLAEEAEL